MTLSTPPKSHEEKLKALEETFAEQSAKAISVNKIRGIATLGKICELAKVDKTHVYGHTPCPPEIAKKYQDFLERVQKFNADFLTRKQKVVEHGVSDDLKLQDAQEDNHVLKSEVTDLEARVQLLQRRNMELLAKNTQLESISHFGNTHDEQVAHISDVTISIICPEDDLERDGRYRFHNEKMRAEAWIKAQTEFSKLMKRNVPQRVYLLMGPPNSGKSTWAKNKNVNFDRHAVIVDATNLKAGDRARWIVQANKASNVKTCIVKFIVDESTLRARNALRHHKMLDSDILQQKIDEVENVDPVFEDVDEMLFVRSSDE
mgnify:CR=1 FL=1|tara:strand:- start:1769 stop:2722 length:954 start_codon:yes stop_codon:yes gene_type:complete